MKYVNYILFMGLSIVSLQCTKAIIIEEEAEEIDGVVSYSSHIETLMGNCTTCHGGAAPSAGVSLTSYEEVKWQAENGNMVDRMNDDANPMPPGGKLSADDLQAITQWVESGFPEN